MREERTRRPSALRDVLALQVALSRGALLWTFVRLMVAERARETGLTPTQQWMEAILTAASDARVRDGSPPLRGRARA